MTFVLVIFKLFSYLDRNLSRYILLDKQIFNQHFISDDWIFIQVNADTVGAYHQSVGPISGEVGRASGAGTARIQSAAVPEGGLHPSAGRRDEPSFRGVFRSSLSGRPPAVAFSADTSTATAVVVVGHRPDVRVGRPQHGRCHVRRTGALHSDAEAAAASVPGQVHALVVQVGGQLLLKFLNREIAVSVATNKIY